VVLLRIGIAAAIFTMILAAQGKRALPRSRSDVLALFFLGILGITVMNLALISGQRLISAALASLIVTSNPVHTAIISRFINGEPLTRRKIGGIAVATCGFLIVLFFGSENAVDVSIGHFKGILICAIAPVTWAFYTVLSKSYLIRYEPTTVAAYTAIAGFIGALPLLVWNNGAGARLAALTPLGWGAVAFVAVFGYVVAYILWYRGLRVLTASQTAVYVYLVPVFGFFFAWQLLSERITLYLLIGGVTILTGVILTNSANGRSVTAKDIPKTLAGVEAVGGTSRRIGLQ
jgi:drug/metabolite transporter (DMT)-like permease